MKKLPESFGIMHNPHREEIERLKARLKELEGNVLY